MESRRGDSNPRPTTYEAVALPLSYSGGRDGLPTAPGTAAGHARADHPELGGPSGGAASCMMRP